MKEWPASVDLDIKNNQCNIFKPVCGPTLMNYNGNAEQLMILRS